MDLDDSISIPRPRKSLLCRASIGNCDSPSNDDDAERRDRRRSRIFEQIVSSPATPGDRRQSMQIGSALAGFTTDQVTEHYANCMKLSAENKISTKNAFGLHLIDYMSDLLKKTDGDKTNFQMASCTLDASTKIYAYRVDCVHADVYKMASGLGLVDSQKRTEDDGAEAEEGSEEAEEAGRIVKKKKKTKSCKVESNLKLLNVQKLDLRFEGDAVYLKMSRAFEEGGVNGLLLNIPTKNDGSELMLDASELHERPNEQREVTQLFLPRDALGPLKQITSNPLIQVCPSLSRFSFLDDDSFNDFDDENEMAMASDHAFDMNAEPEPICDTSPDMYTEDTGYNDCDVDDDGSMAGPSTSQNQSSFVVRNCGEWSDPSIAAITLESTQDLSLILSEEPSEYSYFSQKASTAWAGPHHWHLKPVLRAQSSVVRRNQPHKKPKSFKLLFDDITVLDEDFATDGDHKLAKRTVLLWDVERNTYPEDLHYDPAKLCSLSHIELPLDFTVRAAEQHIEVGNEVGEYNYENENDRENFCPDIPDTHNDDDDDDNDAADNNIDPSVFFASLQPDNDGGASLEDAEGNDDSVKEFTGSNLVAQPYKIDKVSINYARQATKIDTKKLKEAMWSILVNKNEDKENEGSTLASDKKLSSTMDFSEVYKELPSRITPTMAANLSVPTAFVCFLHLVNEQNLELTQKEDLTDFTIGQG